MWETLGWVLTSPNAVNILLFLSFIVILGWLAAKTGLLNIHTNAVTMGAADREREIIRQQTEWVKIHLEGLEKSMPKPEGYNAWRGMYIVETVYDEYVNWITYNHLTTKSSYVDIKQDRIVSLVHRLTDKEEFHSKEFEEFLREDTGNSIAKLVQIREVYK